MIYEEYEAILSKIQRKEKKLFDLLEKRDNIFDKTQPKSTPMDKEIVDGKNPINTIEEYLVQKEYLNEEIDQLNQTLDDWYQILNRKKVIFKDSKHILDRIYYLRLIEILEPWKIANLIPCDRATVYRYMGVLSKKIPWRKDELYSLRSHK